MPPLTAGQIQTFWTTGFLVVERLARRDDLGHIRRRLNTLFARFHELPGRHAFDLGDEGRHAGIQQIPEINWTTRLIPALKRTPTFRAARELAAELLGGRAAHTGFDHAILKPPHNGRATPWHQDGAYAGPDSVATTVHFWIPLHDVSLEMCSSSPGVTWGRFSRITRAPTARALTSWRSMA